MDFSEDEKRLRLRSLHPGVSLEQVQDQTGFPLIVPPVVPTTELPSGAELAVLRERVDWVGALRH